MGWEGGWRGEDGEDGSEDEEQDDGDEEEEDEDGTVRLCLLSRDDLCRYVGAEDGCCRRL